MKPSQLCTSHASCCGRVRRRAFLADCGMGFTGLVLGGIGLCDIFFGTFGGYLFGLIIGGVCLFASVLYLLGEKE